jgi:RNA polymerase sigma factor (sigma-70 family)
MVMDTIRKAARRNELIPMVSIDNTMTLEMRVPDPLFWRNVWRVLDRMDTERRTLTHERHANWHSPSRRVVFRMYYLEDFTLAEIGACFNCSESRVAQIHREALVRLAEQFRGPDPSPRR